MPGTEDKAVNFKPSGSKPDLITAMLAPEFYPKPAPEITHRETHISHLFFAGELVYKLKKPVRFPFLDYSTLGKRRHFLEAELRLNQRLAPSVYLGVLPITWNGSGWQLGGEGHPEEYALVMRRLPAKRMLSFLIETRQVTVPLAYRLAEFIAEFHRNAERSDGLDPQHHLSSVTKQWEENLIEVKPLAERLMHADAWAAIANYGTTFLNVHRDLFMRRAAGGWIRDVHGDLHCDHVCFAPDGIQIFDCIEFDSELRTCDVASEIAFLVMDAEVRGGAEWVRSFLKRYCELMDGDGLLSLLPFYKCYRALVRGKVHALRSHEGEQEAARYFDHAARLTWDPHKPFLVLIGGLTGTGKSTLARALGAALGMPVMNSDVVRKSLANKSGRQTVEFYAGIYSPVMTDKTYAKMARDAEKQILKSHGAILDATFGQKKHREMMLRMAAKHNAPVFVVWCHATDDVVKERLIQRAMNQAEPSDGRWEIYQLQKASYQAMDEFGSATRLDLNTQTGIADLVRECENFLRLRLEGHELTA